MFLDQVHEIMQAAFGWTDSHLHQFGSGPGRYDPGTGHYLCPFQVEEGDPGVPEEDVRLDEVLTEPGDKLLYEYDFGDGWQHTIRLEAILPRPSSAPRAVCITGRRDGPPEDCGGVGAYELICAATDPAKPEHADAVAEFTRFHGGDIEPDSIRTAPFALRASGFWRADLCTTACAGHAGLDPASLVLDDVSTLYFETEVGTLGTGSARRPGRNLKLRVPEAGMPQEQQVAGRGRAGFSRKGGPAR